MADALLSLDSVQEHMADHPAVTALRGLAVDAKFDRNELTLVVSADNIVPACEAAKAAGYNMFLDCTAVDWYPSEPRFQVSYHILSIGRKEQLRLAVMLSGDDPAIQTITGVWPSANFYEREVWDLFGIRFSGHPNLTRIMLPLDWKGHPLRKDYPVEGYR